MMKFKEVKLKPEEAATLELRGLYEQCGYKKYKMGKFEEYSLYAANKDFLATDKVVTFTDLDGRLLALKPDVTLSIIKNTKATEDAPEKFYYIENVYRESKTGNNFIEIGQMGLEYIGKVADRELAEVVGLASKTLRTVSTDYILELSHMDFATELLNSFETDEETYIHLLKLIRLKNVDGIIKVAGKAGINEGNAKIIAQIPLLYGKPASTIMKAKKLALNSKMENALTELEQLCNCLKEQNAIKNVQIDFSMVNDIDYYNGIIFRGYVRDLPRSILAGGQYDRAMDIFGKNAGAVGFALYLSEVARLRGREETLVYRIARKGGKAND